MSTERFVLRHGGQQRLTGALVSVGWVGVLDSGAPGAEVGIASPSGRAVEAVSAGGAIAVPGAGTLHVRDVLLGRAEERGRIACEWEAS
ncbi:hypothetical protein [Cellulomonas soli]|uniref:Uncharacterized protein n=1 Tax=Cellulomonas soli TaxID=931535 RepID=A0A512PEA2_9CELL|nr:hypothetical protein [Cellulomonas soli]NYI58999.1 hypothetical protein [Cellulomonas soli]GEP69508.1 hypothetical protein CSO01_22230 [Cellulomonas soli]